MWISEIFVWVIMIIIIIIMSGHLTHTNHCTIGSSTQYLIRYGFNYYDLKSFRCNAFSRHLCVAVYHEGLIDEWLFLFQAMYSIIMVVGSSDMMKCISIQILYCQQVLQSRNILRANKLLGSFKLDVATVWSQPGNPPIPLCQPSVSWEAAVSWVMSVMISCKYL